MVMMDEKISYLSNKLIESAGLNENEAKRDAEAMIFGKRQVRDGDYAVLIIGRDRDAELSYYKRENNKWIKDNSISEDIFTEKTKVFCNLNDKCISIKNKCENIEKIEEKNDKNNRNKIAKEYDASIALTSKEMSEMLEKKVISTNKTYFCIERNKREKYVTIYKSKIQFGFIYWKG